MRAGDTRVVADGLGYTNEALPSPDGKFLYVNETFARCLTRFRIADGGGLYSREVVTRFGAGTYPDGLAFDAEGGVWITSIVSNRVIRVAADGSQQVIVEDCNAAHRHRVPRLSAGRCDRDVSLAGRRRPTRSLELLRRKLT